MKRNTIFWFSAIYSTILLIFSLLGLAVTPGSTEFASERAQAEYITQFIVLLVISGLMFIGALGFKNKKKFGRTLLIISGIMSFPLGLIIAFYAYEEKKLK